ncbi:substrate-binding domain-containing protein [Mitsuaria sp. GD03876]|uniref:substrate-binding domain-containing protein n=1 Tax=Mitsuaria sp. GD03876 TaxID=2975399 RepID=UPI0024490DF0|nr:substrate-binding domain-containing protein [Mitsuaria sp. GD03876]MDH0865789.1 substrate-binding domain-containing protein [Mitsuaria sp. GD03876]
MIAPLAGISSMATRALLAALSAAHTAAHGLEIRFESIGGVDAARRVEAGEDLDLVVLAEDAMQRLLAAGRLRPGSLRAIADSPMVVAAPGGRTAPAVDTAEALRAALLGAGAIGYSTGPSGQALLKLLDGWGLRERLGDRLRQSPAGVPVATMLAQGEVDLGFQQLSELQGQAGVAVLGPMPPGLEIVTRFTAGVATTSGEPATAQRVVDDFASPAHDALRRRLGLFVPSA